MNAQDGEVVAVEERQVLELTRVCPLPDSRKGLAPGWDKLLQGPLLLVAAAPSREVEQRFADTRLSMLMLRSMMALHCCILMALPMLIVMMTMTANDR